MNYMLCAQKTFLHQINLVCRLFDLLNPTKLTTLGLSILLHCVSQRRLFSGKVPHSCTLAFKSASCNIMDPLSLHWLWQVLAYSSCDVQCFWELFWGTATAYDPCGGCHCRRRPRSWHQKNDRLRTSKQQSSSWPGHSGRHTGELARCWKHGLLFILLLRKLVIKVGGEPALVLCK